MTVSLTSHPGTPAVSAQVFLQTHCVNITIVRVCETTDRILGISVTRHLGSLPRESTEFPSVRLFKVRLDRDLCGPRQMLASLQSCSRWNPWQFCDVLLDETCYFVGTNPAKPGSYSWTESVRRSGEAWLWGVLLPLWPALQLSLIFVLSCDCPIQSSWMEGIGTTLLLFTHILKMHPLPFPFSVHCVSVN